VSEYAKEYTTNELMAVVISRNMRNGDRGLTGMATGGRAGVLAVGIPMVGMALAQMTHAPHSSILYGAYIINPEVEKCPTLFETGPGLSAWRAEARLTDWYIYAQAQRGEVTVGFSSVAQVDKYGNVNIVAIGDYDKPKVRLVGNIYQTEHYTLHRREILVMDHERRNFVEKVDYITGPGYIDGPGARERAGLRWGGPCLCVTNLAVLGFDEKTKRMKLESVHPGVSVDRVKENTGFELITPDQVPETDPPTVEQIDLIRTKIDPQAILIPK
jgi:glutaconate CoA-transferase subunit B